MLVGPSLDRHQANPGQLLLNTCVPDPVPNAFQASFPY